MFLFILLWIKLTVRFNQHILVSLVNEQVLFFSITRGTKATAVFGQGLFFSITRGTKVYFIA